MAALVTPITTKAAPDKLLQAGIFSRDKVEAISNSLNEPAWLRDKRQVAWSVFEETPLPTTSDEDWRRTDLRRIKWEQFKLAGPSLVQTNILADLPDDARDAVEDKYPAAGRIVIANDRPVYRELDPALAEQGVIFTSLAAAVVEHPDLVQKYLGAEAVPPSNSKFAALNSALWQGGVFLYIPKNVEVEHPFQAALILEGEGSAIFPRTLIVAEQSANVTYIEESISHGEHGQALNAGVVEIYANPGAQVRYVDVQLGRRCVQLQCQTVGGREWQHGYLGNRPAWRAAAKAADSELPGNGSSDSTAFYARQAAS
jgi:Fe-S cluster assembly protein SufD